MSSKNPPQSLEPKPVHYGEPQDGVQTVPSCSLGLDVVCLCSVFSYRLKHKHITSQKDSMTNQLMM